MCDPAGLLADQVELLGVPQRRLRLAAIGDLVREASVGLSELVRSFVDQLLEIAIDAPSLLLCLAQAEQHMHRGDQFIRLDRLDEIGIGATIERAGAVGYTGEGGRCLQDDDLRET
jgi:hypothetical protein